MNEQVRRDSGQAEALANEIRTVAGKLKRRLREHGGHTNLTVSQTSVLLRLEAEGPATIADLARAEGMRHQSMRAVVGPLQQAGLVRGASDPSDGRQRLISLTSKCRKAMEKGRAARHDWLAGAISQKLSPQEQQKLLDALELLRRLAAE